MADLKDLVKKRIDNLEQIPDAFLIASKKAELQMARTIDQLLGEMDSVNGRLILNQANVDRISQITNDLLANQLMDGDYGDALRDYLAAFTDQATLTDEIFKKTIGAFTVDPEWRTAVLASQRITLDALGANGINAAVMQPLKENLLTALTTGMSLEEATRNIRIFVTSDETLGYLAKHSRQIAYDAFAFSDANYMKILANNLEADWFRYSGGAVKGTRPFCLERAEGIYHRSQIEAWGALTWNGQAKGTDPNTIWTYRGGYNCRHTFIPVAPSAVPPELRERYG